MKVQKKVGYIVNQGNKLVVPDMITIERTTNENSKDVEYDQTVSNIGQGSKKILMSISPMMTKPLKITQSGSRCSNDNGHGKKTC